MNNLSLISTDDLVHEIENRCVTFLCAYETYEDKGKSGDMKFYYGKGSRTKSAALSAILNNDVMNNWNGELKMLQRIVEEEDED